MADDNLNGSVNLLAQALRQVFTEAVEKAVEPLVTKDDLKRFEADMKADMKAMKADMKAGFDLAAEDRRRIEADMQNGFAELRPPESTDANPK